MNVITIKALIADETFETGAKFAEYLSSNGIFAYTRKKDERIIIDAILHDRPDVLITDLELQSCDALSLMRKLRELGANVPKFVITSDVDNIFVRRLAMENGASAFILTPCEPKDILDAVVACTENLDFPEHDALEILTTDAIRKLGVPAHIKGYSYLRTAVMNTVRNFHLLDSVTKLLYPTVAEAHSTTPSRVERAIRHAIDSAWERGGSECFSRYFGYDPAINCEKPTNSEFIALTADKLKLQLKSQI